MRTSYKPISFPKSFWRMYWNNVVLVSQWLPLNQHSQYTIDLILLASPTGNKDRVKTKGKYVLSLRLAGYSHFYPAVYEMFSPCLLRGKYRQGKTGTFFPFVSINPFCLGHSHYQICQQHVETVRAVKHAQKIDFCHLFHDKWHFISYALTEISRISSRVCRYWFWTLDLTPPKFYVFQKCWPLF